MDLEDAATTVTYLIRDRDAKPVSRRRQELLAVRFTLSFRGFLGCSFLGRGFVNGLFGNGRRRVRVHVPDEVLGRTP